MERTLPALRPMPWLLLLGGVLLTVNFALIADLLTWPYWRGWSGWQHWMELTDTPYRDYAGFRYSPVAAWILPVVASVGPAVWFALHFAVLLLLPPIVGAVVAVSFPLWVDALFGNVFVFVFVAAYLARGGNRAAVIVFMALTLLMPRPVQLPLLAWLLWREPWSRWPFAALITVHALLVAWSGLGSEWIARLATSNEMGEFYNYGPTAILGWWWFVLGIPLAAWLWWRGKPGWAGLALTHYLLPQYWLFALVEARTPQRSRTRRPA